MAIVHWKINVSNYMSRVSVQKKDGVWCEMLVDNDLTEDGSHRLRYVLSQGPTPASTMLLRDTASIY